MRLFWDDQMITMDENVMKFVSSTGFSHFEKGIKWHERFDKLLGTGLFNADGELWKTEGPGTGHRPPILRQRAHIGFRILERTSTATLDLIASHVPFTLDSASEFLFGMKLDTLSQPLTVPGKVKLGPKFDEFTAAFEHVAVVTTQRGAQGEIWPLLELFGDKTEAAISTIMTWWIPSGVATDASENAFLDFLASKTDDVEHIRYELVTYLIASRDTTASLLTFVIYFFSIHPAYTLKTMKYLRAVLNEALRLFPSAPLSSRMSMGTPLVIPASNGQALYLPPKTLVRMCIGQEFALNEAGFFVVKLLQRFKSFRFEPNFNLLDLTSQRWLGKPGRQGVEKIFPAIK
ncbi:cytochrome P450 [Mycena leptocephala]|nr:cytochrome P450 [Mycena leptocephala]